MNQIYCNHCSKLIAMSDMTEKDIFFHEFLCVGCEALRNLSRSKEEKENG